jgi:hypothetical protein
LRRTVADKPEKKPAELLFRVSPDEDGKVYLSLDEVEGRRVEVHRPVSRKTLESSRKQLEEILAERKREAEQSEEDGDEDRGSAPQQQAQEEIDAVLYPMQAGGLRSRAEHVVRLIARVLWPILGSAITLFFHYKLVEYSHENQPRGLHLLVLLMYALLLGFGIWIIATDKNREKWSDLIRKKTPGLLIYPALILGVSGVVFASSTFLLYEYNLLDLIPCRGTPVSIGSLMDFYMWHFMKLVPLLKLNDVLKWEEPLCYSQWRVGFLVLLFQGFVVIPTIAAVRYYWKNRDRLSRKEYKFISGSEPAEW